MVIIKVMDAPKSAYELAMERLKKKDAEDGVVQQKLTDAQKAAIAEARSIYEARVAERQILQREKQLTTFDPAALDVLDQEYHRDLERFATDRDAKIKRIREESK
jgi:hypothetical protein